MTTGCYTCNREADFDRLPPRELIACDEHWRVVHATGSSLLGWLVLVPRRHVMEIAELTDAESASLGGWQVRLARALAKEFGTSKTYVATFGEVPGFHLHFHLMPRLGNLDPALCGPGIFSLLGVDKENEVSPADRDDIATRLAVHLTDGGAAADSVGPIRIRSADSDDVPRLAALSENWAREDITYGQGPDSAEWFGSQLGPYLLVAEFDSSIVAFAQGAEHASGEQHTAVLPEGTRFLEVTNIFVSADFRSRGIGGLLLDRLIEEATNRGLDRAMVYSATKDLDRITSFYRAHGFRGWYVQLYR
jgi:diadenosine tetraphosphate (Ap4A) HIT family hydrolase/ribosomal protein S18 acetylase RimI-like enzyme